MAKINLVKDIRGIIGDVYYHNPERGAKTNELGMTRGQVIQLAKELSEYMINHLEKKEPCKS